MHYSLRQSLVAFHHEMFASALNGSEPPLINDYSQKYADAGGRPAAYYPEMLRMTIADGSC